MPEQGRPPGAEPERVAEEVAELLGEPADSVRRISAKTGEGDHRRARRADRARPAAEGRSRPAAPRADLRLRVRPVPRRDRLHPGRRRHVHQGRGDPRDAGGHRGRDRRHRLLHAADDVGRRAPRRRGRVPDHRHQGRDPAARRRHAHDQAQSGRRAAARLPRGQADGVLRPVPDRVRRLPRSARRAREAQLNDAALSLGARDERRARVRLPVRVPRAAAHGHRARAPRARVRPRAAGDDAERRVRGHADRRDRDARPQPGRHA